jgi:hypothetical protein
MKITVWTVTRRVEGHAPCTRTFATEQEAHEAYLYYIFDESLEEYFQPAKAAFDNGNYGELVTLGAEILEDEDETCSIDSHELDLPAPRIVVIMEGGLLQDVLSTSPLSVAVIDYDTEGTSDELTAIPQDEEGTSFAEACASIRPAYVRPERTNQLYDAVANKAFTCKGCGREESVCSLNPCADVIADREEGGE